MEEVDRYITVGRFIELYKKRHSNDIHVTVMNVQSHAPVGIRETCSSGMLPTFQAVQQSVHLTPHVLCALVYFYINEQEV
jgi:hypothetical protein